MYFGCLTGMPSAIPARKKQSQPQQASSRTTSIQAAAAVPARVHCCNMPAAPGVERPHVSLAKSAFQQQDA